MITQKIQETLGKISPLHFGETEDLQKWEELRDSLYSLPFDEQKLVLLEMEEIELWWDNVPTQTRRIRNIIESITYEE